ncbi:hypothetical protein IFVP22_C230091 [Vibrio parahaemolyticus]
MVRYDEIYITKIDKERNIYISRCVLIQQPSIPETIEQHIHNSD